MTTLWVYAISGNKDFLYSLAVAAGFLVVMKLGSYIKIAPGKILYKNKKTKNNDAESDTSSTNEESVEIPAEATAEEAEKFLGYYN
jgi:hypothetical protein